MNAETESCRQFVWHWMVKGMSIFFVNLTGPKTLCCILKIVFILICSLLNCICNVHLKQMCEVIKQRFIAVKIVCLAAWSWRWELSLHYVCNIVMIGVEVKGENCWRERHRLCCWESEAHICWWVILALNIALILVQ